MSKLKVCVIFGGNSSEHEVSLSTSTNIIENLDREKYEVYMLGITRDGRWRLYDGPAGDIRSGEWEKASVPAHISPDSETHGIVCGDKVIKIDIAYIGLHGKNGEDGTVQGLLELAEIPYSGPGVLGSALCMDKVAARAVLQRCDVPSVEYVVISQEEMSDINFVIAKVYTKFTMPVFVKPVKCGSSIGISKVTREEDLIPAIEKALKYDDEALVEEFVDAREFECGIIGNEDPIASYVGEVFTEHEFYDYDAKYVAGMAKMEIPANLPDEKAEEMQDIAKKAYKAAGLCGLCRIDFFIEKGTGRVILNEINTLPGGTPTSAFPVLFEKTGMPFSEVLDKVIAYALENAENKSRVAKALERV